MKSIWVIQTAFLGDCILSLVFIRKLLENTHQPVHIVCAPGAAYELFQLARERGLKAYADRLQVHTFSKRSADKGLWGLWKFARNLRRQSVAVDKVFLLQRGFRSGLLGLLSGAPERIGFSSGAASFLYTQHARREWDSGRSEVEKNLSLLELAGIGNVGPWSPKLEKSILSSGKIARNSERVAVSLGSPWPTKRWPQENALEFCRKLVNRGYEVDLLGDAQSVEVASYIEKEIDSRLIHNRSGKTSIREWVDLIDSSALVLSGDSAAVHAASDLAVPVLALFGPTVPEFGFAPWRSHSLVLQRGDLTCRPCHIHGPKICPLGHHKCLKEISGEQVSEHALRLLSQLSS